MADARARLGGIALALTAFAIGGCRGCAKDDAGGDAAPGEEALGPNEPVNATPFPNERILEAVNPESLPIYAGPTGVVEGTVFVRGDPALDTKIDFSRCPAGEVTYGKTFREGPPRADGSRPLADALVVITGYSGYVIAERRAAKRITIEPCAFSTRTVDLTFGQMLLVQNVDASKKMYAPELSNSAMPALMVAPFGADPVKLYSKKPGYASLDDKIGVPFMKADVYTLLQPLHAVTDANGHFRIDRVPTEGADGKPIAGLELNVRLKAINRDVTQPIPSVAAGKTTVVDVTLEHKATEAPSFTPEKAPDAGASEATDAGSAPKVYIH